MTTNVIFYRQEGLDQNTKFKLRRELLGLQQKSNFSQYKYEVRGLLQTIPHYRPINSTIIVKEKDIPKIKIILDKYGVKTEIFEIIIPEKLFKI